MKSLGANNLLCANIGRHEHRCFIGSIQVATVHEIEGWYFPIVNFGGHKIFGRSLRTMEAARTWILMSLREMKK